MATTKELAAKVARLEDTLRSIREGLEDLQERLPLMNERGLQVLQAVQDAMNSIASGIRTPQLTVVDAAGKPVVVLQAGAEGAGEISIHSAAGRCVGVLAVDQDGAGGLVLADPVGRVHSRIHAQDGSGRLSVFDHGSGKAISFGL